MFTMDNYVVAESLEQAYSLNQRRSNVLLGGIFWLKMGKKRIGTGIDLSALGLNTIEEDDDAFRIGCMCTLREIENHESLNNYFQGLFKKSIEHIVGVQFRNTATVGGTVFSRFGFSDVLTALLATDSYVELYHGGIVALPDFITMPRDRDILVRVIIKKDERKTLYSSFRTSSGDLPILTCAIADTENDCGICIGARPAKAMLIKYPSIRKASKDDVDHLIKKIGQDFVFGTNIRAGSEYRRHLAEVMVRRNIEALNSGGTGHAY